MAFSKPRIRNPDTFTNDVTDLNTVTRERNNISNKTLNLAIPTLNTTGNRVSNLFGKVRTIQVQGVHYGDGYGFVESSDNIYAFISEMEAWNNAGIQQRKIYQSIFGIQYKVFCIDFTYDWSDTGPEHIEYNMVLVEGGNITDDVISDIIDSLT